MATNPKPTPMVQETTSTNKKTIIKVDLQSFDIDDFIAETEAKLKKTRAERLEWEQQFQKVSKCQAKGIELEKAKDIEGAISAYLSAIDYGIEAPLMGMNNYYYSVQRLMILYRKRKEYEKEIALIHRIRKEKLRPQDVVELEHRLKRATILLEKAGGTPLVEDKGSEQEPIKSSDINLQTTYIFPTNISVNPKS